MLLSVWSLEPPGSIPVCTAGDQHRHNTSVLATTCMSHCISPQSLHVCDERGPACHRRLVERANTAPEEDFAAGLLRLEGVSMHHKYADPIKVDLVLEMGGEWLGCRPLGPEHGDTQLVYWACDAECSVGRPHPAWY